MEKEPNPLGRAATGRGEGCRGLEAPPDSVLSLQAAAQSWGRPRSNCLSSRPLGVELKCQGMAKTTLALFHGSRQ